MEADNQWVLLFLLKVLHLCMYDFTKLHNFRIHNLSRQFAIVADTLICNNLLWKCSAIRADNLRFSFLCKLSDK